MEQSIIHIIVTLIAIPVALFIFQRLVNKKDGAEKQVADERHDNILKSIKELTEKITKFCTENKKEHCEFFGYGTEIEKINTIHHQRGCDQPYMRRGTD